MVGANFPFTGTYLRTNYRATGGQLGPVDIGGGFFKGSAAAGSGLEDLWWGGYVFASLAMDGSNVTGSGIHTISATDVLASYYGAHRALPGYKIIPFQVLPIYVSASMAKAVANIHWSVSDSLIMILFGRSTVSVQGSCTSTFYCQLTGFIASTP